MRQPHVLGAQVSAPVPNAASPRPSTLQVPTHPLLLRVQPADWSLHDGILTNLRITLL